MNSIYTQIELMKNDRRLGANQLLVQALQILKQASMVLPACSEKELYAKLLSISNDIKNSRPTMINIKNGMLCLEGILEEILSKSSDCYEMRKLSEYGISKMLEYLEECSQALAVNGASLLKDGMTLMTCSYSSSVLRALTLAHQMGISFTVFAMLSEYQGQSYGVSLLKQLKMQGIRGTPVTDLDMADYLIKSDKVIIGADALYIDGYIVNGFPSLELVETAYTVSPQIPVWALIDGLKIAGTDESMTVEPGFQKIPLHLFTGIVSEHGTILDNKDLKNLMLLTRNQWKINIS